MKRLRMYSRGTTGRVALLSEGSGEHLSSLERDLLLVLDFDPRVRRLEVETVAVTYEDAGRTRSYRPDIVAEFTADGRGWTEVYEVKYREELREKWAELRPRFKAATAHCRARGWRFRLMTETQIRVPELSNYKFLRRYRRIAADDMHEQALLLTMTAMGPSQVKDVLTATWNDPDRRLIALAYLWRLLATGAINADLSKPLTMGTTVWR